MLLPSHSIKYCTRPSNDKRFPFTVNFSPFAMRLAASELANEPVVVSSCSSALFDVVDVLLCAVVAPFVDAANMPAFDGCRLSSMPLQLLDDDDDGGGGDDLFPINDDRMAAIEIFFESPRIGKNALVFGRSCNGTVLITYKINENEELQLVDHPHTYIENVHGLCMTNKHSPQCLRYDVPLSFVLHPWY